MHDLRVLQELDTTVKELCEDLSKKYTGKTAVYTDTLGNVHTNVIEKISVFELTGEYRCALRVLDAERQVSYRAYIEFSRIIEIKD